MADHSASVEVAEHCERRSTDTSRERAQVSDNAHDRRPSRETGSSGGCYARSPVQESVNAATGMVRNTPRSDVVRHGVARRNSAARRRLVFEQISPAPRESGSNPRLAPGRDPHIGRKSDWLGSGARDRRKVDLGARTLEPDRARLVVESPRDDGNHSIGVRVQAPPSAMPLDSVPDGQYDGKGRTEQVRLSVSPPRARDRAGPAPRVSSSDLDSSDSLARKREPGSRRSVTPHARGERVAAVGLSRRHLPLEVACRLPPASRKLDLFVEDDSDDEESGVRRGGLVRERVAAPRAAIRIWTADPSASFVDAMSQTWTERVPGIWVPPFNLIPRVLSKIGDEQAHGLVVVPFWPSRPWYGTLKSMAMTLPTHLPFDAYRPALGVDQLRRLRR